MAIVAKLDTTGRQTLLWMSSGKISGAMRTENQFPVLVVIRLSC